MAKVRYEGGWYREPSKRGFAYVNPGEYDEGAAWEKTDKFISDLEIRQLIPVLEESGLLVPKLNDRLRSEDLKITHRLLDIVDGLTGKQS